VAEVLLELAEHLLVRRALRRLDEDVDRGEAGPDEVADVAAQPIGVEAGARHRVAAVLAEARRHQEVDVAVLRQALEDAAAAAAMVGEAEALELDAVEALVAGDVVDELQHVVL